jgi:hypothetical protein
MTATVGGSIKLVKDWLQEVIRGITPDLEPGYPYLPSLATEDMTEMPETVRFHRAFLVRARRDWENVNIMPLERRQSLIVRVGYLGFQDDNRLQELIDADEELFARYIFRPNIVRPTCLLNIKQQGSELPFLVGDSNNVALIDHLFQVHYRTESV